MRNIKETVALTSIAASAGLTLAKGVVGVLTGSLAILSEAAHSLIDLAATVMTYFAVRISGKPADEEHHYGHGKVESVTALVETGLLFVLSGIVIWEAGKRLVGGDGHAVEVTRWAFVVIAVSIVVDFFRARVLYRVASETTSEALEADALHFGSDMWSSIAVLIGLVGGRARIPVGGFRGGNRRCRGDLRRRLAARAPHHRNADRHRAGRRRGQGHRDRRQHIPASSRSSACGCGRRRATLFVDLNVAVSRTLPLDRVKAIKAQIESAVRAEFPRAETAVNIEPRALDDETVLERVMVIARNRALAVHHVTVHSIGGRLSVSLDLEVDGSLTLGRAHEIASALEQAARDELGPDVEVETHIEPLQLSDLAGRDAAPERVAAVRAALAGLAAKLGFVRDVHEVRVRETADGEIVNFHGYARSQPHRLRRAREDRRASSARCASDFPSIKRVIGHAEPRP